MFSININYIIHLYNIKLNILKATLKKRGQNFTELHISKLSALYEDLINLVWVL